MADLITNERARVSLPAAQDSDDDTIDTLITAASAAIERWCQRSFPATDHDLLIDGSGDRHLLLPQAPIIRVASVRQRPSTVLTVHNHDPGNQQARVAVTATGLELVRVAGGLMTTETLSFAEYGSLTALAGAINALGDGWSAAVVAHYAQWPSADLFSPLGALSAIPGAPLKLHTHEIADYDIDAANGLLIRSHWQHGCRNYRVVYTSGYDTVPEDVQEACAELVATWFAQRGRDLTLAAEHSIGAYSFQAFRGADLPDRVRGLLRSYRALTV